MDNNTEKQLEEIKNEMISLQAKVESEGDSDGTKVETLNNLMNKFSNLLNNLNLENNEQ